MTNYIATSGGSAEEGICIFCGEVATMTGEHVFGHWTTKAVQPNVLEQVILTFKTDSEIRVDKLDLTNRNPRNNGHSNMRLNVLCRDCNNVWGSALQEDTSLALKPVLRGDKWHLTDQERETVAKWVTSLLMVRQYVHPELVALTDEFCHEFYLTRAPLPGMSVWIGRYGGDNSHECRYRSAFVPVEGNPPPKARNVCMISFVMGKLIFYAFWSSDDDLVHRFSPPDPSSIRMLNLLSDQYGVRKWVANPSRGELEFGEFHGYAYYPLHELMHELGMTQLWPTFHKYSDGDSPPLSEQDYIELNDLAKYAVMTQDGTLENARAYAHEQGPD